MASKPKTLRLNPREVAELTGVSAEELMIAAMSTGQWVYAQPHFQDNNLHRFGYFYRCVSPPNRPEQWEVSLGIPEVVRERFSSIVLDDLEDVFSVVGDAI